MSESPLAWDTSLRLSKGRLHVGGAAGAGFWDAASALSYFTWPSLGKNSWLATEAVLWTTVPKSQIRHSHPITTLGKKAPARGHGRLENGFREPASQTPWFTDEQTRTLEMLSLSLDPMPWAREQDPCPYLTPLLWNPLNQSAGSMWNHHILSLYRAYYFKKLCSHVPFSI